MNTITKKILSIALLMLLAIGVAADDDIDPDADVDVTVNAPEYVSEDTFEVTIDVTEVSDMNGGQFDLTFDPDVINVESVESGMIDDTEMPISLWRLIDDDRIRVVVFQFSVVDEGGVSGSGYLAKITFEVVGGTGDTSAIDMPEGIPGEYTRRLSEVDSDEIPANWFGTNITIGTAPSMPSETPTPTESPTVVAASASTPTATLIETPSLELAPNPSTLIASAQDAPAAAVPAASSENDGLQDLLTTHNFITIYSFVGLLAFIYALTQFK